jgi:N-methylhydantoinase A
LRYEASRTHIGDMGELTAERLRSLYGELERAARAKLADEPEAAISIQRSAEMRYGEQIFEVDVALDAVDWEAADLLDRVTAAFHRRHEELFTYAMAGQDVVLVNARVAATSNAGTEFELARLPRKAGAGSAVSRKVYLGEWREVPVHAMDGLSPGQQIAGPALIDADTTSVLLHDGDKAHVDPFGWLDIEVGLRRE